mmetsp:Transcript_3117/g.4336  ORF Transcript_3117/g.4336 Transcript_3117/m.4336 type:complete len:368 (+) Transcript_3117:105-1208(+)
MGEYFEWETDRNDDYMHTNGGDGVSVVSMNSDDDEMGYSLVIPRRRKEENLNASSLLRPGLKSRDDMTSQQSKYFKSPKLNVGIWLVEAGPSDGNWSNLSSIMIFSATENASDLMIGSEGVNLAGFALHPNPADTYHAGSIDEIQAKGHQPPAVAKNGGGAIGVRYRPFGGENDGGEYIWIAGAMVGRTARAVSFLCVDLTIHGPIMEDTISRLQKIGAFEKFAHGDTSALREDTYEPPVSQRMIQSRLDHLEYVRSTECHIVDERTTISPNVPVVTPPIQSRSIQNCGPWKGFHTTNNCRETSSEDTGDFEYLDIGSTAGDNNINQVSDFDDSSIDEIDMLGRDLKQMDLDQELVWATLIQGSRVL